MFFRLPKSNRERGLTLVEVAISVFVLGVVLISVVAALTYAHRTIQRTVCQNAAYACARSAMEQIIRGPGFTDIPYTDASNGLHDGGGATISGPATVSVLFNGNTATNLTVSTGSLPSLSAGGIVPGSSPPTGTTERIVFLDINNTPTITSDDLEVRLWLWVKDMSNPSIEATQVRAIYLVYHWKYMDGNKARWYSGVIRDMRCAAPTF